MNHLFMYFTIFFKVVFKIASTSQYLYPAAITQAKEVVVVEEKKMSAN